MDVGGTKIKAAIISSDGNILHTIRVYDAKSKESKECILHNFMFIIKDLILNGSVPDMELSGIGMAFPGPFDYINGVSYMKGLNKYEHLYGIDLREELINVIDKDRKLSQYFQKEYRIIFANDGDLFALGAYLDGAVNSIKTMAICIGTGVGSAFIENGKLIKNASYVPKEGWIYHTIYQNGIVDDYISARGLLNISKQIEALKDITEVSKLYDLAVCGNHEAKEVFKKFGIRLREIMIQFLEEFQPDTLVIGGQISKSFYFFGEEITKECKGRNINLIISKDTSQAILTGVAKLLEEEIHQC